MKYRSLLFCTAIIATMTIGGCASPSSPTTQPPAYDATPTHRTGPLYPPRALYEGVEGSVLLCFTVDPDGSTDNIYVKNVQFRSTTGQAPGATAEREIKTAAIDTLKQWRFKPRYLNGKAVKGSTCQTVRFLIS